MKGLKRDLLIHAFLIFLTIVLLFAILFVFGCGIDSQNSGYHGEDEVFLSQNQPVFVAEEDLIRPYSDIQVEEGLLTLSFGENSNSRQKDGEMPQFRSCIITISYPQHPVYTDRGVSLTSETGKFFVTLGLPVGWVEVTVQAETVEGVKYISLEMENGTEIKAGLTSQLNLVLVPEEQQVSGEIDIDIDTAVEVGLGNVLAVFPGSEDSLYSQIVWWEKDLPEELETGKEVFAKIGEYAGKGVVGEIQFDGTIVLNILWSWAKPTREDYESGEQIRLFVLPTDKPFLTISLSSATPLSGMVVAGTCGKVFLNFNLTAGQMADVKVYSIIIVREGVSLDTDINNIRLYNGDAPVSTSACLVSGKAVFNGIDLFISKGTMEELSVKADVDSAAGVGNQISFSINPVDIVAVAVDSGESISVSGTEVRGNAMQVIAGGELICSSSPDQILGVIQGGESGGFFSTTLKGKLKMSATLEDIGVSSYKIFADYEGTNNGDWFITQVRVDGRSTYLNFSTGQIFSDKNIGKDQKVDVDVEADVVFYNRDILPEIAIKVEVIPEATGLASCQIITQDNGGVSGSFTAISARGFLSRDVLQINRTDDQLGFSLYSRRDVEIKNIVVAVETEGDVKITGLSVADYRIFIGNSSEEGSKFEIPMNIGLAADGPPKNFILISYSFGIGSIKLAIVAVDAVDADSGKPIHVVGLPVAFNAMF